MGILNTVGSWLFGSGGIDKVADVADKAFHTEQEKSQEDAKDLSSARAMQMFSHGSIFDIFVDGISRLVRPGVTVWLMGGFVGWWKLPDIGTVDSYWQSIFTLVITFWFGGRAILKDLPAAIKLMRGK